MHVIGQEGRPQGPVEWESDRGRFLGRGRGPENPQALDGRPLSGTTGVLLDPIVSLRQRVRLAPGGVVRLSFATGMASSRETALALAQRYHDPTATARTFALAFAHARSRLHHLGITGEEALLFERLASRVLYADASLRSGPELLARSTLGQEGLWGHGISGDLPVLLLRVDSRGRPGAGPAGPHGAGVLAAEGPGRRRGDPERAARRLPGRGARPAGGAPRRRALASLEASPRRRLPAARGPDERGRADPPLRRGAGGPGRQRGHPGAAARPTRAGDAGAGLPPAGALLRGQPGAGARRPARGAGAGARQRARRLRRGRARVRHRPRGRPGDAAALGQRHRQPRLRDGHHGLGSVFHLVGEQPREPAHAVRERSGLRSDLGGPAGPR